jgi:photosystem II stability/assembly factor-like uncharacterized protein
MKNKFLILTIILQLSSSLFSQPKQIQIKPSADCVWSDVNANVTATFTSMHFTNNNVGYISGNNGTILKTTNGGTSWTNMNYPYTSQNVFGITGYSYGINNWVFGVSSGGRYLQSPNGGSNWMYFIISSNQLNSIYSYYNSSTSSRDIWVVGNNSTIMHSTTNGSNWVTQTTPFQYVNLFDVYFVNSNYGTVVGDNGLVYTTTNGGTNWTYVDTQIPQNLNSVYFTSTTNGWAVGNNGTIIKTTNGGTNWTSQSTGTTQNLYGVNFLDNNLGYAVGNNGTIVYTTNGGTTWTDCPSGTTRKLYDVIIFSDESVYVIGDYGTIKYKTGRLYNLTKSVSPNDAANEGCSVSASPNQTQFASGSSVTLTATAGANWDFDGWSGALSGMTNPQSLVMYSDNSVVANFKRKSVPKVLLTTSVFPAEAAADGSTISPSGANQYDKNSIITLDAASGAGWVWDKWTGSLTGNGKPQQLLMDADKNVVANFQPVLVLGLTSPDDNYFCPPAPNDELTVATASIFVDGVDWLLTGISFGVVQQFKPDFTEAWIEYAGNRLKGTISTNGNGFATSISFSPNQQINEGNTLAVRLYFKFNYPSTSAERYIPNALTNVNMYKISIHVGQISCEPIPVSCRPGVKTPVYPPTIFYSNTQTVASVWNVSRNPNAAFSSIQEAVNNLSTVDGNIIELCPCRYEENVLVNKTLTIRARTDYRSTIVVANQKLDHVFDIGKQDVELNNLTITGASGTGAAGVFVDKETQSKRSVTIFNSHITANYYGINSNSLVTISNSNVSKNTNDGIQCDTLKAKLTTVDWNGGNGVYSFGNIFFESETGKTASASHNSKHGLYSKSNITSPTQKGFFKFNSNTLSGVYCEGNLFEIRGQGLTADSNKEYGIYSKSNLKGSYLSTRHNTKDGMKTGYLSATQIVSDNNGGDGINSSSLINISGFPNQTISASYNKGNGLNSGDWVTIEADSGFVRINKNEMNGIISRSGTEIYKAKKITADSNTVLGINAGSNLKIRNASISHNKKGGAKGGYVSSSNLTIEHNKGHGLEGGLMYVGAGDGKTISISYNDGNGVLCSDWFVGNGGKFKINKNGATGIYTRAGTEIFPNVQSSYDSNAVYGIDSPQNLKIRNASISYNGKGGINGGYISSSNIIADHNKGDGIKGDLIYLYASENKIYSASYNDGNGIISMDWTVGQTENGKLRFNKNGKSGIFSPTQSIEIYGDKIGTSSLMLDSNGIYGAYAKNNLKIRNATASYNGKDGLVCFYISSSNIKADFNIGNGISSSGLMYLVSYGGFRSSANDNSEFGINASEVILRQVNVLRNKKDGINAWILEFEQGAVNNNLGWGAQISGLPSKSKIKTVNLTGNTLGAINYTATRPSGNIINKIAALDLYTILENCEITNNNGPGILYNSNESILITQNNISGNKDFGIQNLNVISNISATNNWWGSTNGPNGNGGNRVQGNISFLNWKSKQISLFGALSKDTLNIMGGKKDSVSLFFKQSIGNIDKVNISILDPSNSVLGNRNISLSLNPQEGGAYNLILLPSLNATVGKYNININAVSNRDTSINTSLKLTLNLYNQIFTKLKITDASPVVIPGNRYQFHAIGEDQFGNSYSVIPTWQSTGGTIDNAGLFTAGNTLGEFLVKAVFQNKETDVKVKIVSPTKELTKIIIYPDSIKVNPGNTIQFYAVGKDQFDSTYAFKQTWSSTAGTIDTLGLFRAGSLLGNFNVKVTNLTATVSSQAKVIVTNLSDIQKKIIPTEYNISQNYPNPFNPSTRINFSIAQTSQVRISIYNILGQEVTELVNEEKVPGNYVINWRASNHSSGIYFCRIVASSNTGNFMKSIKMILIK